MTSWNSLKSPRAQLGLFLGAALVIVLVFYGVLKLLNPGVGIGPPQADSLAFYQYGRAIAEGHPYRYNASDTPTTGSTSHVFPFLLAAAFALGADGSTIGLAGFLYAALFYLLTIAGFWLSARRMAPEAAPLATGLVVLSGHVFYAVFGQTDMGLFTALMTWVFCAALYGHRLLLVVLLVAASFTRPEGGLIAFLLLAVSALPMGRERRADWRLAGAGAAGLAAFVAVFALNHALTGHAQFTSVIGKGIIGTVEWILVVPELAETFREYFLGVLFGLGDNSRTMMLLPVIGGALALAGLISRPWRERDEARIEAWWALTLLGTMAMVSMSAAGVVQFDRYFAWLLPGWFLYAAIGARRLAERLPWRWSFGMIAAVLLLYQPLGLIILTLTLARSTAMVAFQREFIRDVNVNLPPASRVGSDGASWVAFDLDRHTVHNVYGLLSPEFIAPESERSNIEVLKHQPDTRFDFWLFQAGTMGGPAFSPFVGSRLDTQLPLFTARAAFTLHQAEWATLDNADLPISGRVLPQIEGLELVDRIDVGYAPDESRCGYAVRNPVSAVKIPLLSETLRLEGRAVTEAGRIVLGRATMRVKSRPGRELRVVLRTSVTASAPMFTGPQRFIFGSPVKLRVAVDGRDAGEFSMLMNGAEEFTEGLIVIPAAAITGETTELAFEGVHAAYAYWFYQ